MAAKRRLDGIRHFAASSGLYPLCGRGRIKTDPLFAEMGRALLAGEGRSGMILPTGIATDATTQYFFKDLVGSGAISSLYDFENAKPLFESVHRSYKFCLLTLAGRELREPEADFAFFAHDPTDLDRPGVRFALSPNEITLLNPNTGTCPVFRNRRDAEITLDIYRRLPVLIREGDSKGNIWNVKFMQGIFNMTSDSGLFHSRDELEGEGWALRGNVFRKDGKEMVPLFEAKMIHHFDYRWATFGQDGNFRDATFDEKQNPNFVVLPRYWVNKRDVDAKLMGRWDRQSLLAFRNIARSTDVRTLIATIIPRTAVGHSMPLIASDGDKFLQGAFTSFVVDYVLRQKLGGTNLTYNYMQQLPVPTPAAVREKSAWSDVSVLEWIEDRVDWLNVNSVHSGHRQVRAELDAAFFCLYGLHRDDVDYVMESFPIVKRKDVSEFGDYRTKKEILEVFDALEESAASGIPYEAWLDKAPNGSNH